MDYKSSMRADYERAKDPAACKRVWAQEIVLLAGACEITQREADELVALNQRLYREKAGRK